MNNVEMEPFEYRTPIFKNRQACWEDLGKYLETKNKIGWVWLRVTPEVNSDRDFDTKIMKHQGYVRGGIFPQDWNVLRIPGLGEA